MNMDAVIQDSRWVYVVVQDPDDDPQLLGQHDQQAAASFIPAFLDKGAARAWLPHMAKQAERRYEVEAMRFDAVKAYAFQHGFSVYILNEDGSLKEKAHP